MRRDSIFYQLFSRSPSLLFNFVPNPPENADQYRFESVAVKELKFEIDGVFLPPDTSKPGTLFLCEVQFQKDETLYERLFAELFLYFRMSQQRFADWQAVVIYPTRTLEQDQTHPYRSLLDSEQFHRVYLDELGPIDTLPLPIALTVLTTLDETTMPQGARTLIERAQGSVLPEPQQQAIIEMVISILSYKFSNLSRHEVEAMIGIAFQQTRLYQEVKEEGRQEVQQEALQIVQAAEKKAQERSVQLVRKLLEQRFGKRSAPWKPGLEQLDVDLLMSLAEELLELESPREVLEWLIFSPERASVRQEVPECFVRGILGSVEAAIAQRLQQLTIEEGVALIDFVTAGTSLAQIRQSLRDWLTELTEGDRPQT